MAKDINFLVFIENQEQVKLVNENMFNENSDYNTQPLNNSLT